MSLVWRIKNSFYPKHKQNIIVLYYFQIYYFQIYML